MSFNKYNTRNSKVFNSPGQFVRAGEVSAGPQGQLGGNMDPMLPSPPVQFNKSITNTGPAPQPPLPPGPGFDAFQKPQPAPPPATPAPPTPAPQPADVEMKTEPGTDPEQPGRPPWMKARLYGVKKISNKERRRRQNENLRRLLSPKSALMVLNEIMPGMQVANQFKVEAVGNPSGNQYYNVAANSYCADLTLQGTSYKGYGDNKLSARTAAAEQAVRDLILQKMSRALLADAVDGKDGEETETEEETLPMIQLASFALHKLFAEWEYEGHKVPQLKSSGSVSELCEEAPPAKSKPAKTLPAQAAAMHPCMLLTYMRPQVEYRELGAEGDRPQNMLFTMGIEVDGTTYVGKASNKKEARKAAARAACTALFDVKYEGTQ